MIALAPRDLARIAGLLLLLHLVDKIAQGLCAARYGLLP